MSGALQAVLRQVVSCTYSATASRVVYVRHMVYRTSSARILLLDQPCKLRFDEQGKTTVTTAHLEYRWGYTLKTYHELGLKVEVIEQMHIEKLLFKQSTYY